MLTSDGHERVLSRSDSDSSVFHNAVTSLGTYGALTRLCLSCVDTYVLRETITVMDKEELRSEHEERLDRFRHVKYHYIPYTSSVVVYTYDVVSTRTLEEKEGL